MTCHMSIVAVTLSEDGSASHPQSEIFFFEISLANLLHFTALLCKSLIIN